MGSREPSEEEVVRVVTENPGQGPEWYVGFMSSTTGYSASGVRRAIRKARENGQVWGINRGLVLVPAKRELARRSHLEGY